MGGLVRQRLEELLRYDANSGVIYWRVDRGSRRLAGKVAGRKVDGYRQITIDGIPHMAHRLVFVFCGEEIPEYVDHINGRRSDNRRSNLRPATRQQNKFNAKYRSASGFIGVSAKRFVSSTRYQASFRAKGRRQGKYLGLFDTPEEAHQAYVRAACEHYGEDLAFSTDAALSARRAD